MRRELDKPTHASFLLDSMLTLSFDYISTDMIQDEVCTKFNLQANYQLGRCFCTDQVATLKKKQDMGIAANEVSVENGTSESKDLNHGLQRNLKVIFNSQP